MVLLPYDPKWPEQFRSISSILLNKLSGIVNRIEHVGSTAIPGIHAKPKIDIDIVIPVNVSLDVIETKLSELGYIHRGDLGIHGREAFGRMNDPAFYDKILDTVKHNLYACYENNNELENHLLFRDYLRTHNDALEEYENLKIGIAERANQHYQTYVDVKEKEAKEFVYGIVERAKKEKLRM